MKCTYYGSFTSAKEESRFGEERNAENESTRGFNLTDQEESWVILRGIKVIGTKFAGIVSNLKL